MISPELSDALHWVAAVIDVGAVVIGASELACGIGRAGLADPRVFSSDEMRRLATTERAGHRDRPISS